MAVSLTLKSLFVISTLVAVFTVWLHFILMELSLNLHCLILTASTLRPAKSLFHITDALSVA